MSRILTIIKKELRDLVRDRRTMFFMVIFPAVIIPLLIGGVTQLSIFFANKEIDKTLNIAIIGEEYNSKLVVFFKVLDKINVTTNLSEEDVKQQISDGELDAGIIIPSNIEENLSQKRPVELKLYFRSEKGSNISERRLEEMLKVYFQPITEERYSFYEISQDAFEPYVLIKIDMATEQEKFGKTVGTVLPYILLIFCFMGVTYPALGLGAGEKERGTLETILTSPASILEILVGKFIAVASFGIMSVIFGIIGMLAAVKLNPNIPKEIITIAMSILTFKSILLILTLLIPITLFFAAFLLSISFYAKTFKEAQSIMGPLNILIIIPIVIGMMPGVILEVSTAWIPILNVSLAMNDIIAGTLSFKLYIEVMLSLLFFTGCSLWLSTKFVSREEIIFRG